MTKKDIKTVKNEVNKPVKKLVKKEVKVEPVVVTLDKYWAPNGIGHRTISSDDVKTIDRLMKYGWLKEFKEK